MNAAADYENPAVGRLVQIIKYTMVGMILLNALILLAFFLIRGH